MRDYLKSDEYRNKEGSWKIRIEYDDKPDNAMQAEIAYLMIEGPQKESFTYEFRFSRKAIGIPKYQFQSIDNRIAYALDNASKYINKKRYEDIRFTVQTSGTRVAPISRQ